MSLGLALSFTAPVSVPPLDEEVMELRTALTIIGRWYWLVILCTVLGAGAAFFANRAIVPEYEAVTLLAVNQISSEGALTNYDNLLANELLAKSYAETIVSRPVLSAAIAELGLDTAPDNLKERITAVLKPQTQLMQLVVVDSDPQRAADTANAVVAAFREQNRAMLTERYALARQGIEDELALAQRDVDEWRAQVEWLNSLGKNASTAQLRDAEMMLNHYRSTYAALSEALANVRISETQVVDNIDVIELAYPDFDPVWPDPVLNLAVATIAGAIIGVYIALLLGKPAAAEIAPLKGEG